MLSGGRNKRQVWFRFYEELNDFLPAVRKKLSFPYIFSGNQSVKDAIESIGVPHIDVDLILVNGSPVDFSYKLSEGDNISVYPCFESLDIRGVSPLRPEPLRETRFLPDVHLGKLTKLLRLCGFDTLFDKDYSDREIIKISLSERRIILTRDRGLLKNKNVTHGYWIRSDKSDIQLEEVIKRFDLKNSVDTFSRCLECNSVLDTVVKEDVRDRLQPNTLLYYDRFKLCTGCNRLYWEGSHYERMKKNVERIIAGIY